MRHIKIFPNEQGVEKVLCVTLNQVLNLIQDLTISGSLTH